MGDEGGYDTPETDDDENPWADMPGLEAVSNSNGESEDDRKIGNVKVEIDKVTLEAEDLEVEIDVDEVRTAEFETCDQSSPNQVNEAYTSFRAGSLTTNGHGSTLVDINLYDSGASHHMSSHCHRFVTFKEIEPCPISAADNCSFNAIGQGNVYIDVPNGDSTSKVLLRDVLYAPHMAVTLVSISRIVLSGYITVFSGDWCRIFSCEKVPVRRIEVHGGLYRVFMP